MQSDYCLGPEEQSRGVIGSHALTMRGASGDEKRHDPKTGEVNAPVCLVVLVPSASGCRRRRRVVLRAQPVRENVTRGTPSGKNPAEDDGCDAQRHTGPVDGDQVGCCEGNRPESRDGGRADDGLPERPEERRMDDLVSEPRGAS